MDEGSGKQIRISYSYGEDGELTKQTQPDGSSITYEYDSQGRTSAVDMLDADGEKVHRTEYRYDDSGRVTAMTDYEHENGGLKPLRYTGYSYNAFGELAESWEVDGTSSPTTAQKTAHLITYTYGADGSCTSVSYPDNGNGVEQLKYTYNSQKQLTKITAELSDGRTRTVSEYTYTADGKVAVRKDYEDFAGTGSQYIQRTYTYDSFDRVLSMVYNEGSTSDTPEESHTYQYDKASRIIHEETSLNWTGQTAAESEVKDYTYDAKGQLTKSVLLDQDQVQTTTEYTYDTVGNRLKQVETLFAQKENKQLGKEETSYTYNGLDQLLTSQVQETTGTASASSVSSVVYSYDSNGNLTAAADSVKNTEIQYQYDPQGQMTGYLAKVNGTETCNQENSYNGDGQRILRSENGTETGYYYQNGTLLMTETGEGSLDSFYYLGVAGNPLLVMQMDAGNAGYYMFQKDAQGSTRAVIDSSGTCAEWYDYTDFGETTIHEEQEGFLNRICYTGGVYDENTELYYLNARYYNPETGRFLPRDSYRGEAEKPETLHLYLYCANDPVNYVDPSGHKFQLIGAGVGISIALGMAAAGVELIWFNKNVKTRYKGKSFHVFGYISASISKKWDELIGAIRSNPMNIFSDRGLKSMFKSIKGNLNASAGVFLIGANTAKGKFNSYTDYNGKFKSYSISIGRMGGFYAWEGYCKEVGFSVSAVSGKTFSVTGSAYKFSSTATNILSNACSCIYNKVNNMASTLKKWF